MGRGRPVAIRAVLDTSALFPAALREDLQSLAQAGLFVGIWSPWIIAELNRVLTWRWIRRADGDLSRANERDCSRAAKRMMEVLLATFEMVQPQPPYPPAWESLADVSDQPIWAAAKSGGARYVVSGNTRHFPPRDEAGEAFIAMIGDAA